MFRRSVTTLHIEASSIKGLVLKGRKVVWWDGAPLEPGIVRDGLVLEPRELGRAIDALFTAGQVPRDKVILSLNGLHSTFRILTVPQLKPMQMADTIRRVAKKEMPLPLDELYLSWQPMRSSGNKQEVFVLGVPREAVDVLVKAIGYASIKPYVMDLKALALARVANRADALILDLEPENFGITLIANGFPAIMRTFIPKRGDMILEDNVRRLAGEILRTVEFHNRDHPTNPLGPETPVFLTGETTLKPGTEDIVQSEIQYPIEALRPLLEYEASFPVAPYVINIGLGLRGKI